MRILAVIDHYLPGYKSGGPIRSVANFVEWLGEDFQIAIVTSDRDLGDMQPYPSVRSGEWQPMGKAQVLYLPPQAFRLLPWRRVLGILDYDLVYLNSFFSSLTVETLFLRRIGQISKKPFVLAPRGELSPGALSLKSFRKELYIALAKTLGLYKDIIWQVSSDFEMREVYSIFGKAIKGKNSFVCIAPNLPPKLAYNTAVQGSWKQVGAAKIVFLSRIARKKGLDLALRFLGKITGQVEFDIYGPIEDAFYWQECQALIGQLPENIQVGYRGAITPDRAGEVFSQYHLFLLPTRGENFGHVILEALCAGCLVLISDQTPWRNLATQQVGWDVPLPKPEEFDAALKELISMSEPLFRERSQMAQAYGKKFTENPALVKANRELFLKALASYQ
jgi:glycosyltransferase involved in cell wall biosynthesis